MNSQSPKSKSQQRETVQLEVPAGFLERVTTLSTVSASLVVTFGEADGAAYLAPFVELSLTEGAADPEELLGLLMPMESAVFAVAALTAELHEAMAQYARLVSDRLGPEPSRLAAITDYLTAAEDKLGQLRAVVDQLPGTAKTG